MVPSDPNVFVKIVSAISADALLGVNLVIEHLYLALET
jgi:hypothetical protein